jgi:hypothetical protein
MPTGVEDAYNLEVTSRFTGTSLPLFTSCAAGVSICPYRRVPLGTLASSATGGRRALPLILLVLRLLRTTSTLGPLTSSRRMAHGGAGAVAPSAALVLY